jgi:hypothetical protein
MPSATVSPSCRAWRARRVSEELLAPASRWNTQAKSAPAIAIALARNRCCRILGESCQVGPEPCPVILQTLDWLSTSRETDCDITQTTDFGCERFHHESLFVPLPDRACCLSRCTNTSRTDHHSSVQLPLRLHAFPMPRRKLSCGVSRKRGWQLLWNRLGGRNGDELAR